MIAPDEVGAVPARDDARARRAGRPRPAAGRVGPGAEARPAQPHRHEPALLRAPLHRGDRPLRLEARRRRRDAHRGGAPRPRAAEGAVRAGRRPLARRAAVRGRARAPLPRAPPRRGRDRRPRPRRLRPRDRGARARAGRGRARPGAAGAAGRRARPPLPPPPHPGGDAVRPLPVPGARPRLAAAARRPRDRRDPRRRHGAREDGAGDRDARLGARGRRRRPGRRSWSRR